MDENLDMMVDPLHENEETKEDRSVKTLSNSQDGGEELDATDLVSVGSEKEVKKTDGDHQQSI